jgi:hypothetical protein
VDGRRRPKTRRWALDLDKRGRPYRHHEGGPRPEAAIDGERTALPPDHEQQQRLRADLLGYGEGRDPEAELAGHPGDFRAHALAREVLGELRH